MFQLQNKVKTSCMHPRSKYWHLIDFVIMRRSDLRDVKITRAMRGADYWTDQRLIRSQLSMRVRPPSSMKQPCKRLNTNALLTEEVRGNFQYTLNHQLKELSKPLESPPDATTLLNRSLLRTRSCPSRNLPLASCASDIKIGSMPTGRKSTSYYMRKILPTRPTFTSPNPLLIINDGSGFVPKSNTI